METIKVIPNVLIQRFINGASILGVAPVGGSVVGEVVSSVAELTGIYDLTLDIFPVVPDTLVLTFTNSGTPADQNVFNVDADGELVHVAGSGNGGTGTLDFLTGALHVELNVPGDYTGGADDIVADYDHGGDSGETIERGRYRKYAALTDGGLVDIPIANNKCGYRVNAIFASLPGIATLDLEIVDREGHSASVGSITLSSGNGYRDCGFPGVFIAPGCQFKISTKAALSGDGEFMLVLGEGWAESPFAGSGILGSENRVPDMQRA